MTEFKSENAEEVSFNFECECCEASGVLGLKKKDGFKPFGCPEHCGAVYVPWQHDGKWMVKAVVMPVFDRKTK